MGKLREVRHVELAQLVLDPVAVTFFRQPRAHARVEPFTRGAAEDAAGRRRVVVVATVGDDDVAFVGGVVVRRIASQPAVGDQASTQA